MLPKFSHLLSYTTQNMDELRVWKRNQISPLNVNSVNVILIKALEIPFSLFFAASLIISKSSEPVLWCQKNL